MMRDDRPRFPTRRRWLAAGAATAAALNLNPALGLAPTLAAAADDPPARPASEGPTPAPRPADVASIDAILAALYDTISGPKGQARDWNRFRSLFVPGARLIPCRPVAAGRPPSTRMLSVDEFAVASARATESMGFYEGEVARRVERFGHIAHVFSTYESRHAPGEAPFARGINSIQLFWDEARWWVVTIYWDAESPAQPIPPEFLPTPR